MQVLQPMMQVALHFICTSVRVIAGFAKVTCRVFEDNVGTLELANAHKLRPRTKHLSVQLHHFRQCTLDKKVMVEKICTAHQSADAFAKALPRDAFRCLRSKISGWQTFARECHEHIIHDGSHKFLKCVMKIPAAPILP